VTVINAEKVTIASSGEMKIEQWGIRCRDTLKKYFKLKEMYEQKFTSMIHSIKSGYEGEHRL